MSSRAGSTVLTFLMSIPVAAVGLMAVFGVPPLSSVIAASRSVHDRMGFDEERSPRGSDRERGETEESAPDWGLDETETDEQSEEFQNPLDARDTSRPKRLADTGKKSRQSPEYEWGKDSDSEESKTEIPPRLRRDSPRQSETLADPSEEPRFESEPKRPRVSMKESLKKLNALDAKKYHLVPGAEPNTWLFVCLFTPGDDSRVIHRFEAEDTDPDVAVAKTVEQIDDWLMKRFRENDSLSQMAH